MDYGSTSEERLPPELFGIGCVCDLLGLALPILLLGISTGVFALIWWMKGDPHRAGLGSAAMALYGGLVLIPLYLPYALGFVIARFLQPAWYPRRPLAPFALFVVSLGAALVILMFGSFGFGGVIVYFVSVPAAGGLVGMLSDAAGRAGAQRLLFLPDSHSGKP